MIHRSFFHGAAGMIESNQEFDYEEIGLRFAEKTREEFTNIFGEEVFNINKGVLAIQIGCHATLLDVIKNSNLKQEKKMLLVQDIKEKSTVLIDHMIEMLHE